MSQLDVEKRWRSWAQSRVLRADKTGLGVCPLSPSHVRVFAQGVERPRERQSKASHPGEGDRRGPESQPTAVQSSWGPSSAQ